MEGRNTNAFMLSPEWLSPKDSDNLVFSNHQDSSQSYSSDVNSSSYSSPKITRGGLLSSNTKEISPIDKFRRSRSTPQLYDNDPPVDETSRLDSFSLLREKNTWEKNFPTLSNGSTPKSTPSVTPTHGGSPSREKDNPWNKSSSPSGTSTPSSTKSRTSSFSSTGSAPFHSSEDHHSSRSLSASTSFTDSSSLSADVNVSVSTLLPSPTVGPLKTIGRSRVELTSAPKKSSVLGKMTTTSTTAINPFRKFPSEPTLPLSAPYQEKYAVLMKRPGESHHKLRGTLSESAPQIVITGGTDRNDFYSELFNQELRKSNLIRRNSITDTTMHKDGSSKMEIEAKVRGLNLNKENEVSFLRDLDWVPDEEHHEPELTEEEIQEVRKCVITIRNDNNVQKMTTNE